MEEPIVRYGREKVDHHKAIVEYQKTELKHKRIWSCLFILDDVASGEAGVSLRASPVLADLFTKGLDREPFTKLTKRVLNLLGHGVTRVIPRARRARRGDAE